MIPEPPPGQNPIGSNTPANPPQAAPAGGQSSPPGGWSPPPIPPSASARPSSGSIPGANTGTGYFAGGTPPAGWGSVPPTPPGGPFIPMMFPPPPPPRKSALGRFARTTFTTLAGLLVLASITLNIYLLLWLAASTSSGIDTTVIEDGRVSNTIAIIPVRGMILDGTVTTFANMIKQAEDNPDVQAIIIDMDTPGGSVTASDEIYHRIQLFKDRTQLPVIVSMRAMGTSGGYYIACGADYIFAQRSTMTGNIGVMMSRFNLSKFAQEHGIEDNSMHSTGADFKTAGSMWRPETPQEHAYLQDLIDNAFAQFKQVIKANRGATLDQSSPESIDAKLDRIANGKVYMATQALQLGLIDEIGYLDDALAHAKKQIGQAEPRIIRYDQPRGLLSALNAQSLLGAPAAQGNVNIQIDHNLIEEITRPRLMYLWRAY